MPRTGSNIYKRKDGRWEGRYPKGRNDNGKLIYGYVYAKTYTELKKRLNSISQEPPKPVLPTVKVSDIADKWLTVMALKVKQSTFADYDAIVRLH
ncbi:MAG: site-specific integrase, partial [Oscillospiraceae bacterium]|nr:site-specific integrase [Oscillospiraceae bacterium]